METISGTRIKQIRVYLGQSQDEFGRKLGMSPFTLSNYETGKRYPDSRFLRNFKELTGVDINWLFGEEGMFPGSCPGIPKNESETDFFYWFGKRSMVSDAAMARLKLLKLKYPVLFKK